MQHHLKWVSLWKDHGRIKRTLQFSSIPPYPAELLLCDHWGNNIKVTNRLTDFQVCDFALHWTCMDTSPISGLWFWCLKHRRTIFLHRYAIWTVPCKLLQVEKQLKSSSNGEPSGRNERWGLKGRTDSLQAGQCARSWMKSKQAKGQSKGSEPWVL